MSVSNTSSMASLVKKLTARAQDIKDRVESMRGKQVVVGIPESAKYPNGKSVKEVADLIAHGIRDDGGPSVAPPRPFVMIASEENGAKWQRMLVDGVREALRRQKKPNLRPLMIEIGEEMQGDIKKVMLDLDVYDTGRMHSSISILNINGQKIQN